MDQQNLWAPWRIDYLKKLGTGDSPAGDAGCFLCEAFDEAAPPEQNLVLRRSASSVLMLNRYPYTNGHLLVSTRHHMSDIADLEPHERADLMELADLGGKILRKAFGAQGLNIGMNIGQCAGAGVPGHVHMHVVPRWQGDSNFMHVLGQVRVIPDALERSYITLKECLDAMGS